MEKPYVISAELDIPQTRTENVISRNQVESFRESLDSDLRSINKETVWVDSCEIQEGLARKLGRTTLPVVSLDDRYVTQADVFLGISRGVDTSLNDIGYVPRVGYPAVQEQLQSAKNVGNEIILADDVIFGGEMLEMIIREFEEYGIKVSGVVCGIAIKEGIDRIAARNVDVEAVRYFVDVDDELCERDLVVVPGSGRRLPSQTANALYFDPTYGKPTQWASIPASEANGFAARNYRRAAALLQPSARLSQVGNFYGLDDGDAQSVLEEAAQRAEKGGEYEKD